ncbi:MAG TPA: hypothetical protein VFA04_05730 [Bryobacteraceae bacterium]|nr:hypothetical protein [Bryobacteraceae bacterium]
MAKRSKDAHGVGTDRGGGAKAARKESAVGGKGAANKKSASTGAVRPPKT